MRKTAIRYIRISKDKQSNYSIASQDLKTKEWCDRNDVTIADTFIDEGFSAKTFDRPDMQRLQAFIKQHHKQVDYLVVQEFDRFSRDAGEAMSLIKKLQSRYLIQVVGVTEGIVFDYRTPGQFFRTGLQLLLAEDDNIRRAHKINLGIYTAKKKEGRFLGAAPFGYKKIRNEKDLSVLVVDDEAAAIVRFIFKAYLQDIPIKSIRQQANSMGMKFTSNGIITKILTRFCYTALLKIKAYQGKPEEIVEATHEPIISRTDFFAVQQKLKGGSIKTVVHDEFPLRSVLKCYCGRKLTAASSTGKLGGKFGYYKCHGPKHLNLSVKKAHSQLEEILQYLSLPQKIVNAVEQKITNDILLAKESSAQKIFKQQKDLETVENRLYSVEQKFIDGQLNADSYNRWYSDLSEQRFTLKESIHKLNIQNDTIWSNVKSQMSKLTNMLFVWEISDTIQKQQLIKLVFDSRLYYQTNTYRTPYILPIFSHNLLIMKEKGLLIVDDKPFEIGKNYISGAEGSRTPVQTNSP